MKCAECKGDSWKPKVHFDDVIFLDGFENTGFSSQLIYGTLSQLNHCMLIVLFLSKPVSLQLVCDLVEPIGSFCWKKV
jgi:hypothetical protein